MKRDLKGVSIKFLYFISFLVLTSVHAQEQNDTLLFTIKLNEDTASLYGCVWNDKVKSTLAGPVLMEKGSLLFFSQNGYVIYDQKGKILDSHTLFKLNKGNKNPYRCAYPLDSTTMLYYRELAGQPPEVFQKKLFKGDLKKVPDDKYALFSEINRSLLFNIASNSITDEMSTKTFIMPHLVGYTSLTGGMKWWTTDKMYSFSSPIIIENENKYVSFFPGLKVDQPCDVKRHLIEPLGVYLQEGRWFYFGLYSSMGNTQSEYFQTLVLCDQAGNILSSERLLKQEITNAVLTYVKEQNTDYTIKKAGRHTFVPAIDRKGNLFYGTINYEWKKIDVYERIHHQFYPFPTKINLEQKFTDEGNIAFSPIKLECNALAKRGVHPEVIVLNGNDVNFLDNEQTTRKGYFVTVHRHSDDNLHTKLQRIQSSLPPNMQRIQDSIAKQSTSWCPYVIGINNAAGEVSKLFYGFGDVIMCARVVEVTNTNEIFVRVDLDNWAEMLVFSTKGKYLNRFIFNRQPFDQRKDLIVISEKREIVERDYESDKSGKSYYLWEFK
jgi:hypothetical protein